MASIVNLFGRLRLPGKKQDGESSFEKAKAPLDLFPGTDPAVDGDACLHDCASCTVNLPRKWSIDEDEKLYGQVNGWHRHLIVATGKTDWVRDVAEEKGSFLEAFAKHEQEVNNGRIMMSASNMPVAHSTDTTATTLLLLPSFTLITNVTATHIPTIISDVINPSATNLTPLYSPPSDQPPSTTPSPFTVARYPHDYLILLCSHATRDARCGQSAPLLRREFERHLRPMGLLRDLRDDTPGGVGVYFISHLGGHKFAANVMIYRRRGVEEEERGEDGSAVQCIWLARVRPEDCENIVRYTLLQGRLVKPERQLRGGFDRCKQLISW